jgi:hypothetical protein
MWNTLTFLSLGTSAIPDLNIFPPGNTRHDNISTGLYFKLEFPFNCISVDKCH